MSDNTQLNAGSGGDLIRSVAKTANAPVKTQMTIIDVGGGADGSPEIALTLGQAVKASSVPVTLASDQGTLSVSWASVASVATSALASSLVLKAGAGSLYSIDCCPTLNGFLMLFDATSAPADGAVTPKWVLPMVAANGFALAFNAPMTFSTGIVAVFSSTGPFTKTASAAAFISGQAQ